jgi:hypothetical protein
MEPANGPASGRQPPGEAFLPAPGHQTYQTYLTRPTPSPAGRLGTRGRLKADFLSLLGCPWLAISAVLAQQFQARVRFFMSFSGRLYLPALSAPY